MHFSGTSGRLYIRKYRPFLSNSARPNSDWASVAKKREYLTALNDDLKFNDPTNFVQIANVQNWSLNGSQEVLDATTMGDTDRVYCPGPKSATGQCRILYYSNITALGSGDARNNDERNSINKLAPRFFKIARQAYVNGLPTPGTVGPDRTHDDGRGAEADPFLFRFAIADEPNNSIFNGETPVASDGTPLPSNYINIDYWAHITSFNLAVGVGEIYSADISFQCIGAPTVVDQ